MYKSFLPNVLIRPLLAGAIAISTLAGVAARATDFTEVADFQTIMNLPAEARANYVALLRETITQLAEHDAGTDHEFFGGSDVRSPIVSNGWRGGYVAILNAFTQPAQAQVGHLPFYGSSSEPDYLTDDEYNKQRKEISDRKVISVGRAGSAPGEADKRDELAALDAKYKADGDKRKAANEKLAADRAKLTADYDAKLKSLATDKTLQRNGRATESQKGHDSRIAEEKTKVESEYKEAMAKIAPGAGTARRAESLSNTAERADCPKDFESIGYCIVPGVSTGKDHMKDCVDRGGVVASSSFFTSFSYDCATPEYFEKRNAKEPGYKLVDPETQRPLLAERKKRRLNNHLCAENNFTCPDLKTKKAQKKHAQDVREVAKLKKNKCINAGNVSAYRGTSESRDSAETIKPGSCDPISIKKFGPVTVACEADPKKPQVLCNPILFDTDSEFDETLTKAVAENKEVSLKGRCVNRGKYVTSDCNRLFNQSNRKSARPAGKHFWDAAVPGVQESFRELGAEMNQTCGNRLAQTVQCGECKIIQSRLADSKKVLGACPTQATNVPLPPARPKDIMPGRVNQ